MLNKLMCKLFVKLYGGEVKSIGNDYYVQIRRESLEPTIKVKPFGFINIGIYAPIIVIENNYDRIFTEDEMKFAIYHELAHCKLNHFKVPGRHLDQEVEADIYALRKVGKDVAMSALEKVKEEARWTAHENAVEVALRIFECSYVEM